MKAITEQNPWGYLICLGIKDIENRTWSTKYRGRVYIHAAATSWRWHKVCEYLRSNKELSELFEKNGFNRSWLRNLQTSAIIGHVDIVDCVVNHPSIWAEKTEYPKVNDPRILTSVKPTYNWVLRNPVLFDKPILNVKGKLSFWNYPHIKCGIDEDGRDVCLCNLPIDEKDQVLNYGNGDYRCVYCDGKWYK